MRIRCEDYICITNMLGYSKQDYHYSFTIFKKLKEKNRVVVWRQAGNNLPIQILTHCGDYKYIL